MITISLDEQGVFEHNDNPNGGIVMIAGIIYDDHGDSEDSEREKTRIREYFSRICGKFHAPYPGALHICGGWSDRYVGKVKEEYKKSLDTFLKKGMYKGAKVPSSDGKDRSGEYYVFSLIKSPKGKPELSSDDVSNLIKEGYASNLYMHMVEDAISRILFYNNFFLDHDSVSLDLATRVYMGRVGEDVSAHTSLGFDDRTVRDGTIVFLTNSNVFRTALAREMLYETENDIKIKSLEARSINYFEPDNGHEFLYLSDAICTFLGANNTYEQGEYISKTWDRLKKLSGNNRLLFLYDAVDTGFSKAWKYTDSGNIYKALSTFYDFTNRNSKEANFYRNHWEDIFRKHIVRRIDTSSFTMAVRQFSQSIKNNNLKPKKLVYIYEALFDLKDSVEFGNSQDNAVLYDLFDSGAAAYNHLGDSDKAQECISLCKQYAKYVGVERELRNRNKYVVSLCDSLEYEKAINVAQDTYEYYKSIFEIQKSIYGEAYANVHDFGIINSQLGQCYAFANDSRAEDHLLEALSLFDKGTPDYYQTESYLLHYYVQSGNREKYLRYSKEFFGGKLEPIKQLEYVVSEGIKQSNPLISFKFALFIFVKGLYTFFLNEISADDITKIIDLEATIRAMNEHVDEFIGGYPWEIIYKYLALICISKKDDNASVYLKKILGIRTNSGILNLIKQCNIYSIANAAGNSALKGESKKRAIEAYNRMADDSGIEHLSNVQGVLNKVTFLYY